MRKIKKIVKIRKIVRKIQKIPQNFLNWNWGELENVWKLGENWFKSEFLKISRKLENLLKKILRIFVKNLENLVNKNLKAFREIELLVRKFKFSQKALISVWFPVHHLIIIKPTSIINSQSKVSTTAKTSWSWLKQQKKKLANYVKINLEMRELC